MTSPPPRREIAQLEHTSRAPQFWDDTASARRQMQRLAGRRRFLESWRALERRLSDAAELLELAVAEGDEAVAGELEGEAEALARELARREFELAFASPYDTRKRDPRRARRRRRHGVAGLGGDAPAHVSALV